MKQSYFELIFNMLNANKLTLAQREIIARILDEQNEDEITTSQGKTHD